MDQPEPGEWMPTIPDGAINLASGYPFQDAIPGEALTRAWTRVVAEEGDRPFQYLGSEKPQWLREWIGRSIPRTSGDRILVTMGSLQALDLACRALVNPDHTVLVQSPTYMEALEIVSNYTPHRVGVPNHAGGFDVDQIAARLREQQLAGHPVRLIYWQADFQNPSGLVTSLADRRQLLAIAEQYDAYVVEDAAYRELAFAETLPTLKQLDTVGRVLYLGTLSKTLAPGLRIGWAVGPSWWVVAMERFKKDLGQPLVEAVVGDYLRHEDHGAHVKWLSAQYRGRAALVQNLLASLPTGFSWSEPEGGYFLWLGLSSTWSDSHEATRALQDAGVVVLSGRHFCLPHEEDPRTVRVSFSYQPEARLVEGVRRLVQRLAEGPAIR